VDLWECSAAAYQSDNSSQPAMKGYGATADTTGREGDIQANPSSAGDAVMEQGEEMRRRGLSVRDNVPLGSRMFLQTMLVLCGVSTFVRSESVLLQVQLFADCFKLGDSFCALACRGDLIPPAAWPLLHISAPSSSACTQTLSQDGLF